MPIIRILALSALLSAPLAAQDLTIKRPDGSEVVLSAAQLAALPRVTGEAMFHENRVAYEGSDIREVLRAAGVQTDSLRGPLLRRVVLFVGADGYGAALALSDLDPTIGDRQVVLVDRENGASLPAERGPRRVIVVGDHRPARSVRQVTRVEVVDIR